MLRLLVRRESVRNFERQNGDASQTIEEEVADEEPSEVLARDARKSLLPYWIIPNSVLFLNLTPTPLLFLLFLPEFYSSIIAHVFCEVMLLWVFVLKSAIFRFLLHFPWIRVVILFFILILLVGLRVANCDEELQNNVDDHDS